MARSIVGDVAALGLDLLAAYGTVWSELKHPSATGTIATESGRRWLCDLVTRRISPLTRLEGSLLTDDLIVQGWIAYTKRIDRAELSRAAAVARDQLSEFITTANPADPERQGLFACLESHRS